MFWEGPFSDHEERNVEDAVTELLVKWGLFMAINWGNSRASVTIQFAYGKDFACS